MKRWMTAGITLVAAMALSIAPASAHSSEVATDPLDGASLAALPASVSVTMDEKPMDVGHAMVVSAPDGTQVSGPEVSIIGHSLSVPIIAQGPAGDYKVGYRVVSADGHVVTGSFTFTVTSGRPMASDLKQTQTNEDENSVTFVFAIFSLVMMGLFLIIAALLLRRHNRGGGQSASDE